MGRGTILADLGEGQYTIKLDFGESRLAAQLLLLTGANTELDTQIAAQQVKVNTAQTALNASNAALAVAIEAYVVGKSSPNLLPAVENAKLDQVAKEEALRSETVAIGKLQSAKANNLRKIDQLNSYRVSLTLNAWCADYTEAASGEVATLEIPNEPKTVLIAPGGRAPVNADGELRMRALMTPPQAYYNAAILPGWQKFKPTYRSGVITAISGDTADVLLNEAKSSASDIADIGLVNVEFDVNQTTTLNAVPIVYQDCNAEVFEVGDNCVIEFQGQNWNNPKLIGFISNPRACFVPDFKICYSRINLSNPLQIGQTRLNVLKDYISNTGQFRIQTNTDTTQNFTSSFPWSDFRTYGSEGDVFFTMTSYFPNILDIDVFSSINPNTGIFTQSSEGRYRYIRIGRSLEPGNYVTSNILGYVVGHALKKVNGNWYLFIVERFGVGSTFPGYNAQRMLRTQLSNIGGPLFYEVVHEFFFTETSVTGMTLPNAGNVVNPVNFNSTCTQAVSLISLNSTTFPGDNTALVYTITGINVTVSKQQLLPLTVNRSGSTLISASGHYVIAADYDNNDNLVYLKLSIDDASSFPPIGPSINQIRNIAASTLDYGWGSIELPARSYEKIYEAVFPYNFTVSVTNPANLHFHFWDPKSQIFNYSILTSPNGNKSTEFEISGSYYYNQTKMYDYPTFKESPVRTYGQTDFQTLFFISRRQLLTNNTIFSKYKDKFHYFARPLMVRPTGNASTKFFLGLVNSANEIDQLSQFSALDNYYYTINSDNVTISQIRSAMEGGPLFTQFGSETVTVWDKVYAIRMAQISEF